MTEFYWNSYEDIVFEIRCDGHADGSPEVCAAISCICYTLVEHLFKAKAPILNLAMEDGYFHIIFCNGKPFFEFAETAFELLAKNYPWYCRKAEKEPLDFNFDFDIINKP